MARSTFQIESQDHLPYILCGLHFGALGGVYGSPPADSLNESFGFFSRVEQFFDKLIVGLVVPDRGVQPVRDGKAAFGYVPCPGVIIA